MSQEGLEMSDGGDAAPSVRTSTAPTTPACLFSHLLPLWLLLEWERGHFSVPTPPKHVFSAVPYADMGNHFHRIKVMGKPWPTYPPFFPSGALAGPSAHYLFHHGARHIEVGLLRVGDHQVVDVVPLLSPHVA